MTDNAMNKKENFIAFSFSYWLVGTYKSSKGLINNKNVKEG